MAAEDADDLAGNVVRSHQRGCYILDHESAEILGTGPFSSLGVPASQAPDLSVDPRSKVLTFVNSSKKKKKSFAVSVSHECLDCDGEILEGAESTDADGKTTKCTTFLAVLPASSFMDVCTIKVKNLKRLVLSSDVHHVEDHPAPTTHDPAHTFLFPLRGPSPFLCTQGINGAFTHFQKGTYHAIDFACPIGTPVHAGANGVVVSVKQDSCASGINVSNLFHWNSIMLQYTNINLFVEYVHIQPGSVRVAVGERVNVGDVICLTGSAGFSPEPHLHIQAHLSSAPDAPTVMFAFQCPSGAPFVPVAGSWYSDQGLVQEKT
eukprot:m.28936 g.28936  ORF g.28936 m.28936 type:complete len:320 (-) comp9121_c1_seq2:35-994(-)